MNPIECLYKYHRHIHINNQYHQDLLYIDEILCEIATCFPRLMAILYMLYQELVVSRDHHSPALQGIIVQLELCSPLSTSVLWGHGVVTVD